MTKNILILYGHPDTSHERLCYALSKAFQDSALLTGHSVRRIDISDLDFDTIKGSDDFRDGDVPNDIKSAQEVVEWADHILFIFPLWMGTMPGKFKMFIEQVFSPWFCHRLFKKGISRSTLEG